jgi:hypothetical protein
MGVEPYPLRKEAILRLIGGDPSGQAQNNREL